MAEVIAPTDRGRRKRLILICMIAQNAAMGLTFGSFGPLLAMNEAHFGTNRAEMSFGMSAIMTALGVVCALGGGPINRMPVRAMVAGAMLCAIGYGGLVLANGYYVSLLLFGLLGAGASLLGIMGPVTLATRWVNDGRGRVLSIINLPLVLFVTPYAVAAILPGIGREIVYGGFALIFIALIPLLFMLPERPRTATGAPSVATPHLPSAHFFARMDFWLVALGIGILAGIGTAYAVHAPPLGVSRGLNPRDAALLLSISSAAGIAGTLLFGWLADRLGPPMALALAAIVQALMLAGLAIGPVSGLMVMAALLGTATTPLTTLHGAALANMFGPEGVSKAMGYSFVIKLPFIFAVAPLMGWAFVVNHDYRLALLISAGALLFATLLFLIVRRRTSRRQATAIAPPVISAPGTLLGASR